MDTPTLRRPATVICAALVVAALLLIGCGSEDSPAVTPSPTTPPASTATPVPTPTSPPTPVAPAETSTPESDGPQAPDFSLPTGDGATHTLDGLLAGREALVLVFYRSYL